MIILKDRVKNDHDRDCLKIAPVHNKMRDSFEVIWTCEEKTIDNPLRGVERLQDAGTRSRGKAIKTWRQGIKKDSVDSRVTDRVVYDKIKWSRI